MEKKYKKKMSKSVWLHNKNKNNYKEFHKSYFHKKIHPAIFLLMRVWMIFRPGELNRTIHTSLTDDV